MQPSSLSRTLTEDTLHVLLGRYGGVGDLVGYEPVSQGLLNRGYRVTTTRGRYFLKHHLDGQSARARIECRHRVAALLGELGLPVVPVVPDADGRSVVVAADGRCFALHPWIEGGHRHGSELSLAQCAGLGTLLGRVHTRLTRAAPEAPCGTQASADPAATYETIGALLERVRARRRRDSFDELAEHRLTERRALLRRHARERPDAVQDRFCGWVHGDFHPLNLLYAPGGATARVVAILDWDRLDVQPRAEEAVRGAAIFFLRPGGTLDLRRVRAFARAYRGGAHATREELAAAVHRVWWERLNDFWMLRWRYERSDGRVDVQFPAAAALVVWWTAHYEKVRAAFCD
ncbi:phosphotransferase [Streptomyces sp. PU-14G]|uniref:phosphotransferase n=1 Tax=Streptomyces sp. PU-14G TaxID=2800808 RepID=UPI0034DE31CA